VPLQETLLPCLHPRGYGPWLLRRLHRRMVTSVLRNDVVLDRVEAGDPVLLRVPCRNPSLQEPLAHYGTDGGSSPRVS
jgi:hypothetical protein